MLAGRGDMLPVSAFPVDGTYPSATSRWEKRNIAERVAEWDAERCIQCGNCAMVCPHAVIRAGLVDEARLALAPAGFPSAPIDERGFPSTRYTLQVYVEDCTGCGLCVEVCPVEAHGRSESHQPHRAGAAARSGARQRRVLRVAAGDRARPGGLLHGARHPVPRADVRVLGRLRRVRRDAVPRPPVPSLRRPDAGRQRHRVLVHLRRQPAHDAVVHQRRRAGTGVVQLAVRGQRGVRAGDAPRGGRPARHGAPPHRALPRGAGRRSDPGADLGAAAGRAGDPRAAAARRRGGGSAATAGRRGATRTRASSCR